MLTISSQDFFLKHCNRRTYLGSKRILQDEKANNLQLYIFIYKYKVYYTILSTKLTVIHLEQSDSINTVIGELS